VQVEYPGSCSSTYRSGSHGTGWRRCIGCLQLQVSFRKSATNDRALLRKMNSKDKAFYESSPPCSDQGHTQDATSCADDAAKPCRCVSSRRGELGASGAHDQDESGIASRCNCISALCSQSILVGALPDYARPVRILCLKRNLALSYVGWLQVMANP